MIRFSPGRTWSCLQATPNDDAKLFAGFTKEVADMPTFICIVAWSRDARRAPLGAAAGLPSRRAGDSREQGATGSAHAYG